MTLVIEEVKHAEYRKDGSVVFYVTCEGVSGVLDVTLQSGTKNEHNNSVLQAWLDSNTPSAYFNKKDLVNAFKTLLNDDQLRDDMSYRAAEVCMKNKGSSLEQCNTILKIIRGDKVEISNSNN